MEENLSFRHRSTAGAKSVRLNRVTGPWLSFTATALPTFLHAPASYIWLLVSGFLVKILTRCLSAQSCGFDIIRKVTNARPLYVLVGILPIGAMLRLLFLPTTVVFIRVQASLLPDGGKTMIPFDRTLGVRRARARGYLTTVGAFGSVSWSQ